MVLAVLDILFYLLPIVQRFHEDYSLTIAIVFRGMIMLATVWLLMLYKAKAEDIKIENELGTQEIEGLESQREYIQNRS